MAKSTKQDLPSINMNVSMSVPKISIKGYPALLKQAERIEDSFSKMTGNEKDLRLARTKLNRLSNSLNRLRVKYHRTYEAPYRNFKSRVDTLRHHINNASQILSSQLDVYAKEQTHLLIRQVKREIHSICTRMRIPDFPVPKECLKKSLSHAKRYQLLTIAAKQARHNDILERSRAVGDKMVDPVTGEITGAAVQKQMKFKDSSKKYRMLLKFLHDNGICVIIDGVDASKRLSAEKRHKQS